DVTEHGWKDASICIKEVILGSAQMDDDFANMLVEAYLVGASKYDIPLAPDFAGPEVKKEEEAEVMRKDLHKEALVFIKEWRENVVRHLEQGLNERHVQRDSAVDYRNEILTSLAKAKCETISRKVIR